MERDTSYRGRIGEKVKIESIIPKSTYDKKNKEHSWEYREYPEFNDNFVCISQDGTLGDIWKVGDYLIGLPNHSLQGLRIKQSGTEITKNYFDKKIVNKDVEPNEAKWVRKPPPIEFKRLWNWYKREMKRNKSGVGRTKVKKDFLTKRQELYNEFNEFIRDEYFKRKFGMFIKIDNETHYITGANWMFLQHYYLTESNIFPLFRVTAMETWWHWEACKADTRVWGEIRGKARRTSWSVESASLALDELTITKYAEIPIVSERKDLAKKLFTGKIVNSFNYYPLYFKPVIDLPNEEVKSSLQITFETDDMEISTIDYYPTKTTAYDSLKVKYFSINDEIGKWEDASLTDFITRHMRCHTEGGATGRFGSTAGEYKKGGGKEFKDEFEKADITQRNKLGRTQNGLASLFIDVCYTMTQPISYFDEWGYSIVYDPKEPIKNEIGKIVEHGAITDWQITFDTYKKLDDKKSLNAFLRDMPRTPEHMFRNEGGVNNDFEIDNLNNHVDHLDKYTPDMLNERIIYRGNLAWSAEPYNSNVVWKPNPKGRFHTTWIPDPDKQNKHSIKLFYGRKLQTPDNQGIGCFGVDSYDIIGNTGDGNGSDGAIAGYTNFNMAGAPSHSFFLKYKERPNKRDDFYDDVIMACQFWGFNALIESNKARLLEYMYDKGFTGYVLRRQDKPYNKLTDAEQKWGGIPSSTPVIEDQMNLLKNYIFDNVGINLEDDCKVWFIDLIQEWIDINPNKRKLFDLGVASGMAIMGAQYKVKKRKSVEISQKGGLAMSDFSA